MKASHVVRSLVRFTLGTFVVLERWGLSCSGLRGSSVLELARIGSDASLLRFFHPLYLCSIRMPQ